jgi:L-threonylcarbamoyladenylate synthase
VSSIAAAARALRDDRLVVYPTDTLLGLGALARSRRAVDRLARLKERPPGQPISVTLSSVPEIDHWAELTPAQRGWVRTHLPGPYTILVRATPAARRELAREMVSPEGVIGIRVPDHPVARALALAVGPVTATSANKHGAPPARSVAQARAAFGGAVTIYLPARPRPSGRPSTLVDLTGDGPNLTERR